MKFVVVGRKSDDSSQWTLACPNDAFDDVSLPDEEVRSYLDEGPEGVGSLPQPGDVTSNLKGL